MRERSTRFFEKLFTALWATLLFGTCCHSWGAQLPCTPCHPKESAAFLASPMGRSIGSPARTVPAGKITQTESGSLIQITWTDGQMKHHLKELGFRADYNVNYQIGAGKVGYSYITKIGDYLVQSPASYYQRYGWDVSPGFKESAVLDFDRVLGGGCLFCHTNNAGFAGKRKLAPDAKIEPLSCERCHGDTQSHIAHPSRTNIVNPLRLSPSARNSVCEQCHLEGVARILNPGRSWTDIHPGQPLETALSIYIEDGSRLSSQAVNQVEQLSQSRCARESAGKLWCGICHDPHAAKPADRSAEVRTICKSCHPNLTPASHPNSAVSDCVGCHMPRLRPTDVAHAASTDHRLLANPSIAGTAAAAQSSLSIRAWNQPALDISQRNLGLAKLEAAAARPGLQPLAEEGAHLLESLRTEQQNSDPQVLAALADLYLNRGNPESSAAFFRRALSLVPTNADYALYLGIALKAKGDTAEAAGALQNAITLDPSLQRAYLELSALYTKQGKPRQAADVLRQSLRWNSQSILIRSTLDGLP